MTTSSVDSSSCVCFADLSASSLYSSSGMHNMRDGSGADRPLRAWSLRTWALGMCVLALLLLLSSQAFSQSCSVGTCTGLCLQQTTCSGSATTSISGTVYAPNGTTPLPNVLVYVPNAPLASFPAGVTCGVTASGCPLVSTVTATNGTFTLTNMPVGTNIPLVIQAGKWRTQTTINNVPACVNTPVSLAATGTATNLPQVHTGSSVTSCKNGSGVTVACTQGDIPQIAVVTGAVDAAECVLMKLGVDDSEFTNPAGSPVPNNGRINFYLGASASGSGQTINAGTPSENTLFASQAAVDAYDLLMFPCQGQPTDAVADNSANQALLANYANAGGHVYATHYSYQWLNTNVAFAGTVNWDINQTQPTPDPQTGFVNTSTPQGAQLAQWLQDVGASTTLGQISLDTLRKDQNGVLGATQSVLTIDYPSVADPTVMQLTFNTPLSAQPANQCGQVLFNEYHVENTSDEGETFPAACPKGALTPQEQLLGFSLVGLSTVVSAQPAPMVTVAFTNSPASFVQGDSADTITINVTNTSTTSPTNPSLTLTVAPLPAGLVVVNMVGSTPTSGWTCNTGTLECTRTAGLSASTSDAITLTVSVAPAAPASETVSATAAGGGIAANVTGTDTISVLQSQTITFPTVPTQTYGAGLITLNATASSGLPVNYSFISGPAVLSGVNYNTVTITGVGAITVQANQAGNATYAPATPVPQTFMVNQQTPTVNVTSVVPAAEDLGAGPSTMVSATLPPNRRRERADWRTYLRVKRSRRLRSIELFASRQCNYLCDILHACCHGSGGQLHYCGCFAGDSNYVAATSPQVNNFTINLATATTTVTSNQNPSVFGQPVTLTATINGEFGLVKGRNGASVKGRAHPQDVERVGDLEREYGLRNNSQLHRAIREWRVYRLQSRGRNGCDYRGLLGR